MSAILRQFLLQSSRYRGVLFYHSRSFQTAPNDKNVDLMLSDNCVKRLKSLEIGNKFLRVVVEGGGCSGFQYQFEIDDSVTDADRVFEREGVRVIVDAESLTFMHGSVVDYEQELIKSGFVVTDNPQAELGCSCGASFNIKL